MHSQVELVCDPQLFLRIVWPVHLEEYLDIQCMPAKAEIACVSIKNWSDTNSVFC
jgi:hypothetical protein